MQTKQTAKVRQVQSGYLATSKNSSDELAQIVLDARPGGAPGELYEYQK